MTQYESPRWEDMMPRFRNAPCLSFVHSGNFPEITTLKEITPSLETLDTSYPHPFPRHT